MHLPVEILPKNEYHAANSLEVIGILKFILFSILILTALGIIAIGFFYMIGVVSIIMRLLGVLLIIGVTIYICMWLFGHKGNSGGGKASLRNQSGKVAFFENQPSYADLTLIETSLTNSIKISADTDIEVLDEEKETVKVKIRSGSNKGKVGWISATDIVR